MIDEALSRCYDLSKRGATSTLLIGNDSGGSVGRRTLPAPSIYLERTKIA